MIIKFEDELTGLVRALERIAVALEKESGPRSTTMNCTVSLPSKGAKMVSEKADEPAQESRVADGASDGEAFTTRYTLEDVRSAVAKLAKKGGTDAARGVLKAFNADKVTALSAQDYEGVMKAVEEGLTNAGNTR